MFYDSTKCVELKKEGEKKRGARNFQAENKYPVSYAEMPKINNCEKRGKKRFLAPPFSSPFFVCGGSWVVVGH